MVTSVWCFVCNPEQPPEDGGHCVHSQAAHITSSMRIACESAVLLVSSAALKVRRLSDQGFLPKRAIPGSAGYDVRAPQDVVIPAGTVVKVPLDIAIEVPEGSYARLATRSSFAAKRVHIVGGVIDPEYRGNVTAAFENQGDCEFPIRRGDRIAQIVLENIVTPPVVETQELSETSRGAGVFDSTGSGSQDTFLPQENSDNQTNLSDIHTPKHTHIHDTVVRSDFLMNSVIGVLCTLCNLFATKSGSGIPVTGSGIPVSVSPECGISGTGSGNPESSSLKGIKSGTGCGISVANDPGCGTPGPGCGIPGNQPGSGYPELHTVLQPFTGLEVPNNLQQVKTALKESLQGLEVPLTHMAIFSYVLNMVSALAGLGSPGGTGVMYSKVHPLSTSTNTLSPVQDDSHANCVLSAVLNDDDVIYDDENTVFCSALEDQTVSSDRPPPSRESYAPDYFMAGWGIREPLIIDSLQC